MKILDLSAKEMSRTRVSEGPGKVFLQHVSTPGSQRLPMIFVGVLQDHFGWNDDCFQYLLQDECRQSSH